MAKPITPIKVIILGLIIAVVLPCCIFLAVKLTQRGPDEPSSSTPSPGNPAAADPMTILADAERAHGSVERFAKARKGQAVIEGVGNFQGLTGSFSIVETYDLPGFLRREVKGEGGGEKIEMLFVTNQNRTWSVAKRKLTEFPMKEPIQVALPYSVIYSLIQMRRASVSLSSLGEHTFGARPVVGFRVEESGRESTVLFDKKSHCLAASLNRLPDTAGGALRFAEVETAYSEYRELGGLMIPMKIVSKKDGQPFMTMTFLDVKFLDTIDPKIFEKPKEGFDSEEKFGG